MKKQEQKQKARADWFRIYQQLGSISMTARTRRPHRLTSQKLDEEGVNQILDVWVTHRYDKNRISLL